MWATSKHDVYLMSNFLLTHYSSLTSGKKEVLNVRGHVAPSEVSFYQNVKLYLMQLYYYNVILNCSCFFLILAFRNILGVCWKVLRRLK